MKSLIRCTSLLAAGLLLPMVAQANNGHFMVDHAVIADPGRCQLESWITRDGGSRTTTLATTPACTLASGWQLGLPIRYNTDDSDLSSLALEAKTMLGSGHNFGDIALTLGTRYERQTDRMEDLYVNVPWSAEVTPNLVMHLNAGLSHRRVNSNFYGNWGLAGSYRYTRTVDLVLEAATVGSDSPSLAVGARIRLQGFEIDFSAGRDLERNDQFASAGINLRF
jgi:hypothetical protein